MNVREVARETLRDLSKAELHVHLTGTLEYRFVSRLANKYGVTAPSALEYKSASKSSSRFFSMHDFVDGLLREPEDFTLATIAYLQTAYAQGVRWVEMSVEFPGLNSPLSLATVLEAIHRGFDAVEVGGGVILTLRRGISTMIAQGQVASLEPLLDQVLAIGIAGREVGRLSDYADAFKLARSLGLRTVAHAGPTQDIDDALGALSVGRIDHGFRVVERPDLSARATQLGSSFTICPMTNVLIGPVQSLAEHPLRQMLALGLRVSLASDDPGLFGYGILDVYAMTQLELQLTNSQMAGLARESVDASFADADTKRRAAHRVSEWLARESRRDAIDSPI
jgi:adenosine deaminase